MLNSRHSLSLSGLLAALVIASLLLLFGDGLAQLDDTVAKQVFIQLRMPLWLTAALVGATLALCSACLQVLLRNPLADPGIIGITNGASLMAALILLVGSQLPLGLLHYLLPLGCFIGALVSTFTVFAIARKLAGVSAAVILAGIAISTVCGALVAWLHLFSDAQSMRNLTFWLMGSLHQADWLILSVAAPVLLVLNLYLAAQGRKLNLLYFGGKEAQLMGVDFAVYEKRLLLACALAIGVAVSIAGSIAFVGLIVPHVLRLVFGADNRFIMPASALFGALLLMTVTLVANQFAGFAIPVSMLTASIGAPVFLMAVFSHRWRGQ